jgi:hypothetical protein
LDDLVVKAWGGVQSAQAMLGHVSAHKVLHTISKKHTHHNAFAIAFSNTLFIPDKNDRLKVEAYLKRKNLSSSAVIHLEKPDWLWKQVRQYIPEKDFLYHLLNELFKCWGPVKCTVTGQALFSEETWKKAKGILYDVQKDGYQILLVFHYILSDFMISIVCLSIIASEAPTLLKVQCIIQSDETLHH